MDGILHLQKKLIPDIFEVMQKRYNILRTIRTLQPVGRRSLSLTLNITERILRSEVEFLKDQKLILVASSGMTVTNEGEEVLEHLGGVIRQLSGIDDMERLLQEKLDLEKIIIVSGDSDQSPWVIDELGRAGASRMKSLLTGKNIIAVTGGTTMASIGRMLPDVSELPDVDDILFVPARGGLGKGVQYQANTVCEQMAEKMHSRYRVLYVPDNLSEAAYNTLTSEPAIHEVLDLLKSANIVLHGIGEAKTMAERRKSSDDSLQELMNKKAIGEAFGYYYDEDGNIIQKVHTIGLQLDDLVNAEHVIAVAGGASKAKAIKAYIKMAPKKPILITDEGAAIQLLKG
jgi:central glycolytic genes regulator